MNNQKIHPIIKIQGNKQKTLTIQRKNKSIWQYQVKGELKDWQIQFLQNRQRNKQTPLAYGIFSVIKGNVQHLDDIAY